VLTRPSRDRGPVKPSVRPSSGTDYETGFAESMTGDRKVPRKRDRRPGR
jgi:hypothetical protein